MRTSLAILLLLLPVLGGCKKTESTEIPAPVFHDIKVDLPRLMLEFAPISPDALTIVQNVEHNIRYGLYPQARRELEKLARLPNLTESQNKTAAEVTQQLQQLMAKAGAKAQ